MRARVNAICPALLLMWTAAQAGPGAEQSVFDRAEAAYRDGDYLGAARLYEKAVVAAPSLELDAPEVMTRLGRSLLKAGHLDDSEAWLGRARREGSARVRAIATRNLGRLHQGRNDLDRALELYVEARDAHASRGETSDLLVANTYIANAAVLGGRLFAAYEAYEGVLQAARDLGDTKREAVALEGLAHVLTQVGELEAADWQLRQAGALYAETNRGADAAGVALRRARVALAGERYDEALAHARDAAETGPDAPEFRRSLAAVKAYVALYGGRVEAGLAVVHEAVGRADPAHSAQLLDELHLVEARLHLRAGDAEAATRALDRAEIWVSSARRKAHLAYLRARVAVEPDAAIRSLDRYLDAHEAARDGFDGASLRQFFRPRNLRGYEQLVTAAATAGRADLAWRTTSLVKSRSFAHSLLQRRRTDVETPGSVREAVKLGDRIAAAIGVSASPKPRPRTAVLDYFVTEDAVVAVWVAAAGARVARTAVDPAELGAHVAALHEAIRGRGDNYREPARWLADRLLAPFAEELGGPLEALAVAAHGELHRIPFELLPYRGRPLVHEVPIFYAANVPAALNALAAAPMSAPRRVSVVGDATGDLSGARRTSSALRARWPQARVRLGSEARESGVRSMLPADLLHLAVHGRRAGSLQP